MGRVTKRNEQGTGYYYPRCFEGCGGFGNGVKCEVCGVQDEACRKLGKYEDLEEQGRLIRMPFAIGDVVYMPIYDRMASPQEYVSECVIEDVSLKGVMVDGYFVRWDELLKCYYFTLKDAEAALGRQGLERGMDTEKLPDDTLLNVIAAMDTIQKYSDKKDGFDVCALEFLKELEEHRRLEKQGRLLKLPCAVGDTVYEVQELRKRIQPYTIIAIHISDCGKLYGWELKDGEGFYSNVNGFSEHALGKTVFLTWEEAEEALGRAKRGRGMPTEHSGANPGHGPGA